MAKNKHPDKQAIIGRYQQGASLSECGQEFGLSGQIVWKILKKHSPESIRKGGRLSPRKVMVRWNPEIITGTILADLFDYNFATGKFFHKMSRGGRSGGIGSIAGHQMDNGYLAIGLPGKRTVLAHRLAWLWMTGEWPQLEIDHINGDRQDNRWCNLRLATRHQQSANGGTRITNTTGKTGVCFDKARNMYAAQITVDYRTINLGRFKDFEAAVRERVAAEQKYFGEFAPAQRESWRQNCH